MTQKIHIVKVDSTQTERAVQMRTDNPLSPIDKQIWYNEAAKNLSVFVGGVERVLNLRVLANDPSSPVNDEAWINATSSTLKYKYNGVIYSLGIGASIALDGSENQAGYLKTLTDAELKTISDLSLNYPTYMIDSFNESKPASVTYTNAEVVGSRLRPAVNQQGIYERLHKTSAVVNSIDGIIVATVQGLQPEVITVVGGTQHTVRFKRDLTGLIKNGGKLMGFEVVTVDGKERNLYMIDATTSLPLQFTVASAPVYNSSQDTTTVTLTTSGFDITLGKDISLYSQLRFFPWQSVVSAGGNATTGASTLSIQEAYNLETKRVLGEPVVNNIEKTYPGGVFDFAANCSANRLNWLILAKVRRTGALGDDYVVWFSVDGLKTVQQATNFTSPASPFAETHASANDAFDNDWHNSCLRKENIIVHDDGRFIFGHRFLNAATWYKMKGYFGKMSGGTIDIRMVPKSHDQDGEISIGARHETDHVLAMDWETDLLAATFCYNSATTPDPYILFYKFNWTTMSCQYLNYCFPTASYNSLYYPIIMFWKTFEGEKMLFWTTTHNNGLFYAYKYPAINILNIAPAAANISATTFNNNDGKGAVATQLSAFSNTFGVAPIANRADRNDWTHQQAATHRILGWTWNKDETELLVLKHAVGQGFTTLNTLNFGRTSGGTLPVFTMTFPGTQPDISGTGSLTLTVTNTRTGTSANTTTASQTVLTAANLKTFFETATTVGAGNCVVTGTMLTGFTISFLIRDPFTVVTLTNTWAVGGSPVTVTWTTTVPGVTPTWLHFPISSNVTTVYQYSAAGSILVLDQNCAGLFNYEGGSPIGTQLLGRHLVQQRMLCGENNEIYLVGDWQAVDNANDLHRSRFIKIPDYQAIRGYHYVNSPATIVNYALGDTALGATYGRKIGQIFTVPTAGNTPAAVNYNYSDGKVHIRTIALYGYNSYSTQKTCNPNHKIKVSVYGTSGANPDLTNKLAESIEIREMDFHTYPDTKWYPFPLTTDLRLTPGQVVAFVIEANWDPSTTAERNPTGLATTTKGIPLFASGAGSGIRLLDNTLTTWTTVANSLYFKLYDFWYGMTSDMQANPYYQGPAQLNGAASNEDSETTIAWTTVRSARKISLTYRNSDFYAVGSANYTGSHPKTFQGYVLDTIPYSYPTFTVPKLVGNNGTIDPYQVLGVNFGDESSRFINPRLGTTETIGTSGNVLTTEGYNNRVFGGILYESQSNVNMQSLVSRTGAVYGIVVDSDFAAGKALQFAASSYVQYRYGTYGLFPGPKDFCIEFEYKPSTADIAAGQRILISHEGGFRFQMIAGKYDFQLWGNPGETWDFKSLETIQPGHQIIRCGRTFATGAFMQVSYNKGASWTTLSMTGASNPLAVSGGRVLGLQTTGYDIIRFGDYSQSVGTYSCTGAIGYFKYVIGASLPMYSGMTDLSTAPIDVKRMFNFGDRALYIRMQQQSYSTLSYSFGNMGLSYFEGDTSSIKATYDQVFKFKQSIAQGRNPYLKLDMIRQGTGDPLSLQGYVVNFERK